MIFDAIIQKRASFSRTNTLMWLPLDYPDYLPNKMQVAAIPLLHRCNENIVISLVFSIFAIYLSCTHTLYRKGGYLVYEIINYNLVPVMRTEDTVKNASSDNLIEIIVITLCNFIDTTEQPDGTIGILEQ